LLIGELDREGAAEPELVVFEQVVPWLVLRSN
jgi:hypothetical protein